MPQMRTVQSLIISALMHFSSVQLCVTALHSTHSLPLRSLHNSLLPGVNEPKWGVDESGEKAKRKGYRMKRESKGDEL